VRRRLPDRRAIVITMMPVEDIDAALPDAGRGAGGLSGLRLDNPHGFRSSPRRQRHGPARRRHRANSTRPAPVRALARNRETRAAAPERDRSGRSRRPAKLTEACQGMESSRPSTTTWGRGRRVPAGSTSPRIRTSARLGATHAFAGSCVSFRGRTTRSIFRLK
jgi:hypothetical protein